MPKKKYIQPSDLQGISRILTDAVFGVTQVVEAMHQQFVHPPFVPQTPIQRIISSITRFTYQNIKLVTKAVGLGLNASLGQIAAVLDEKASSEEREGMLAALNGILGDYLAESDNSLCIPMQFRFEGKSVPITQKGIANAYPQANGKILLMVHGLCMNDLQWRRNGHDHGVQLAQALGFTPIYLHYNSGLHISTNGHRLAELLEELLLAWPVEVEELLIVAHSMGGLLTRSAMYDGKAKAQHWTKYVKKIIFLGTPHHGAPLERAGNYVDVILDVAPYTQPLSRLGKIRSSGITDLRYGNIVDEDWQGVDRFEKQSDERRHMPLPDGVDCYAVAATTGKASGDLTSLMLGDGLVYLDSALGRHKDAARQLAFSDSQTVYENNHWDLLSNEEVFEQMKTWLSPQP
jgi:pimeloyl-ACP methyl ester carboxylesterase